MSGPFVSVILPTWQRAEWLGRAIDSVLAQTWPDLELIVIDDGSSDGTADILRRYGPRIRAFRQDNQGPYVARNLGLRHAKGDLIAFADSDDVWYPDKLERQLPLFGDPEVGLVFADMALVQGRPGAVKKTGRTAFGITPPARGNVLEQFVRGNFASTLTAVVRRECLDEIGGFGTDQRVSEDYLAWVRIARKWRFDYVDAPLAECTVHRGSISFDLGRSLAARIALFEAELARCSPEEAPVIGDILFTLAVHLSLATVRRRAGSVDTPFRRAGRAASHVASPRKMRLLAAFAGRQVRRRYARALPV